MKKNFFASCPRGLETLLIKEMGAYAFENVEAGDAGVSFSADWKEALKSMLQLRTTSRLLMEIAQFELEQESDIYERGKQLPWSDFFSPKQTFRVQANCHVVASRKFKNPDRLALKLKDAIVDQMRQTRGERPSVDRKSPEQSFVLRLESPEPSKYVAKIFLDLCGLSLDHRGYRVPGHAAPIREHLAAGIIMSTDWNPEEDLFLDSMCGSGTLLLEALLIKGKIPPTFLRLRQPDFAVLSSHLFLSTPGLESWFRQHCKEQFDRAYKSIGDLPARQFFANDQSAVLLQLIRQTMQKAMMHPSLVTFSQKDACTLMPPGPAPGIIICNPPWGIRMAENPEDPTEQEKLEEMYYAYGEQLKKAFKGWRAWIFTASPQLLKKINLQTSQRIPFFSGSIECRLLRYELR